MGCQSAFQQLLDSSEALIDLGVKRDDLHLGPQVHLVVAACLDAIARVLPVLAHHDYRRLQGGDTRQDQVQEDVRIGIELVLLIAVDGHPRQHAGEKNADEPPAAAKARYRSATR